MRSVIWLIDQWLPQGKLTLLAGAGGTGKTTLALGIAAAITSGGLFPNGQRYLGKSNVLIWSSEDDPEDILTPRLAAMGADLDKVFILKGTREEGKDRAFNPATDLESLRVALNAVGGVVLILLDPVIGMVSGNSDKANDVREGLDPLVKFSQDQQCAIIGISHFGKGGQLKDPAERVLGSQAFTALPRMVWATVIDKETGDRVLVRAKTNLSARDGGFLYSVEQTQYGGIDTSVVIWKGQIEGSSHQIINDAEAVEFDGESGSELGDCAQWLKSYLEDVGGSHEKKIIADLARANGFGNSSLYRAKNALKLLSKVDGFASSRRSIWMLPTDSENPIISSNSHNFHALKHWDSGNYGQDDENLTSSSNLGNTDFGVVL
jgi:putative DNA primase/helicase